MNISFFDMLSCFMIYSILGWIMESIFRSICEKKIINTGFLIGPVCPIYGIGSIIMLTIMGNMKGNMPLIFVVAVVVLTFWEYIVGVFLEKAFKTKYWDYSDHKFNFQGRICLTNSIAWGFLWIGFIEYIHPFVSSLIEKVDYNVYHIVIYVTFAILIIDTIVSIIKIVNIKSALEKVEKLNEEIKKKVKDLKEKGKKKTEEIQQNTDNIEIDVKKLENRRNKIMNSLYRYANRLKNAFPAINIKEITEILNKRKQSKDKRGK